MTNFDFLQRDKQFAGFSSIAVKAEHLLHIDVESCVLACRRAMEFAVKWMYTVDDALHAPDSDTLVNLMGDADFRALVDGDVYRRMDYIRKLGNSAAHTCGRRLTPAEGALCLENLYYFMDFVACCYATDYRETPFNPKLLELTTSEALSFVTEHEEDLHALLTRNPKLREELTARRVTQQTAYVPKPIEDAGGDVRRLYLDVALEDAGWREGDDLLSGVRLPGGLAADKVLYGDDGRPLAFVQFIEASETPQDALGQTEDVALALEKQGGRRPAVFLTDGFGVWLQTPFGEPLRQIAALYSRPDLEKLFTLKSAPAKEVSPSRTIADRYYQIAAVERVLSAFAAGSRRVLVAMAAGAGKTRTVVSVCDALFRQGRTANVLYLAERQFLVTQALRAFEPYLADRGISDLGESRADHRAGVVFSTYDVLKERIDETRVGGKRVFTPGHFDLVICDEASRSVSEGCRDVLNYFDAPLLSMTAEPPEELDDLTLTVFAPETRAPVYVYEHAKAVADGYLADYVTVDTKLRFDVSGGADALSAWLDREDLIAAALDALYEKGLKVDGGKTLGKTILFARDRQHAAAIEEVFQKRFPDRAGDMKRIDGSSRLDQSALDAFADPARQPRIALSAGLLDIGVDVPGVLNLVFFRRVESPARLRQMIGRGTRLCKGLIDGADKTRFYVFDFCSNFEYFRLAGHAPASPAGLSGGVFALRMELASLLGAQNDEKLASYRKSLVSSLAETAASLPADDFAVRQHLREVLRFSKPEGYDGLSYDEAVVSAKELSLLFDGPEEGDDERTLRFDALLYDLQRRRLANKPLSDAAEDLAALAKTLHGLGEKPELEKVRGVLEKLAYTNFAEKAGVVELEAIRRALRALVPLVPADAFRFRADPFKAL
ncbi:MAG: DEAD/DEAH box helicase family protein [Clostridia bacterium]|nr:DEAD/DEAH box helicase family protein [Clostridia bacterium]